MENRLDASTDNLKGNTKEVVGKVTGDKEVETKGKLDQVKASVKHAVEDVKDALK